MNSNEFFRCLQFFLPKIATIYIHGAVNANDFQSPRGRPWLPCLLDGVSEDITEEDVKGTRTSMSFLFPEGSKGLNPRDKNRPRLFLLVSPFHPSHQFRPPSPSKTNLSMTSGAGWAYKCLKDKAQTWQRDKQGLSPLGLNSPLSTPIFCLFVTPCLRDAVSSPWHPHPDMLLLRQNSTKVSITGVIPIRGNFYFAQFWFQKSKKARYSRKTRLWGLLFSNQVTGPDNPMFCMGWLHCT